MARKGKKGRSEDETAQRLPEVSLMCVCYIRKERGGPRKRGREGQGREREGEVWEARWREPGEGGGR